MAFPHNELGVNNGKECHENAVESIQVILRDENTLYELLYFKFITFQTTSGDQVSCCSQQDLFNEVDGALSWSTKQYVNILHLEDVDSYCTLVTIFLRTSTGL